MCPNLIKYVTHTQSTLPPITALAYSYIMASNGIFLRAENRFVKVLIPIVPAKPSTVRGLFPLSPFIKLKMPPMPISLLGDLLADARQMRSCSGQLNEVLYRFHYDGQNVRRAGMPVRVNRPEQDTSITSVKTNGDGGSDVILELHSHGNMRAFWSETDNRDEQGFRIYGVIGRLDSNTPQMRIRVGVHGYHYPITQDVIFSDPNHSPFIDLEKDAK